MKPCWASPRLLLCFAKASLVKTQPGGATLPPRKLEPPLLVWADRVRWGSRACTPPHTPPRHQEHVHQEGEGGVSAPWPGCSSPVSPGLPGSLVSSQAQDSGLERSRLLPLRIPLRIWGKWGFLALIPVGGWWEFPFALRTAHPASVLLACGQAWPLCCLSFSSKSDSVSVYGEWTLDWTNIRTRSGFLWQEEGVMLETLAWLTTVMRVLGCGPDHFRKQPTGFFLFLRIFFFNVDFFF